MTDAEYFDLERRIHYFRLVQVKQLGLETIYSDPVYITTKTHALSFRCEEEIND